jgi:hypothetical protein
VLLNLIWTLSMMNSGSSLAGTPGAEPVSLPVLKGKSEIARIEEAQAWIQKKIPGISISADPRSGTETVQVLYFLESHLETLKSIPFKCKNRDQELEDSIERSLPRGAKPEELTASHLKALKDLFSSLCPK